jgi:hypothetical protein
VTPVLVVIASALAAFALVRRARRGAPADGAERLLRGVTVLALASGMAVTTVAALLLALGSPDAAAAPPVVAGAALACAAAGLLAWRARRTGDALAAPLPVPAGPGAGRLLPAGVAVACLAVAAAFVVRTANEPNGHWDAFTFWNVRGRMMLRGGSDPAVVFSSRLHPVHPDYPLHVPGSVATAWWILGEDAWWAPALVAAVWLAVLAAATGAWAAKERGAAAGCAAVLLLLAAPHVVACASWQFADVPLAATLALSFAWLRAAWLGPGPAAGGALALSGACAGLAVWTKNEGWPLLVSLALVVLARPPPPLSRPRAVLRFLAGAAPLALVTLAFKTALVEPNDLVKGAARPGAWHALLDLPRIGRIAGAFLAEPFRSTHWSFLFPAALGLALLPRRGPARPGSGAAWAVVLLVTLAYGGVYVLTPHDLEWHLVASLHRLFVHLWPAVVVLALARAWPRLAGESTPQSQVNPGPITV